MDCIEPSIQVAPRPVSPPIHTLQPLQQSTQMAHNVNNNLSPPRVVVSGCSNPSLACLDGGSGATSSDSPRPMLPTSTISEGHLEQEVLLGVSEVENLNHSSNQSQLLQQLTASSQLVDHQQALQPDQQPKKDQIIATQVVRGTNNRHEVESYQNAS